MGLKIVWTDPAVEQFTERLDYIGGFSPDAARRLLTYLAARFASRARRAS